jgi:alanine racemase
MFEFDCSRANCSSAHTTLTRSVTHCSQLLWNGTTKPIAFATNTVPNNSPRRRVEFSRSALDSNLAALAASSIDAIIDLRCDAYGHGADWVRDAAESHGFDSFLADDEPFAPIPSATTAIFGINGGARVATLSAEIVAVKHIAAGEHVSYGYTWTADRSSQLGLVSLGFADGLPRAGSNVATMTIEGHRVPVVGRIAMDQCVVDITDLSVTVGSTVSLWDSVDSIAEWSTCARRDPLSLVSGLSWRVERSWVS